MNFKHRVVRSICGRTGKVTYQGYFEAKAAARSIRDSTTEDHGSPYRCEDCGQWHLGRARPLTDD